ncbi:MAG: hypothetical protein Q9227_007927 [Pyrenula ochraceoflavens]
MVKKRASNDPEAKIILNLFRNANSVFAVDAIRKAVAMSNLSAVPIALAVRQKTKPLRGSQFEIWSNQLLSVRLYYNRYP